MAGAKFEIEKFTGQNDFGLWKVKMKVILMQQGAWKILKDGKPLSIENLQERETAEMEELEYKAYSTLLLYINESSAGGTEGGGRARCVEEIRNPICYKIHHQSTPLEEQATGLQDYRIKGSLGTA